MYMKKGIFLALASLLIMGFLAGCGAHDKKKVLARIDRKETITLADFNNRIANLPARYQDVVNKNKKEFLDELIIDRLL